MKKYSQRNSPVFSRDDGIFETHSKKEPAWVDDFVNNLEKTSKNNSLYDEINAILNNKKPKYSTVEQAVEDMKKRTGLTEFLNQKMAQNYMEANDQIKEPAIFESIPELKIFIDNFVKDRPGIAIEAVADSAVKINSIRDKLPNRNDVGDDVRKYINDKILECKNLHPINEDISRNIGKMDAKDHDIVIDDPLAGLEPTSGK